jgi:hypothetical protein
MRQRLAKKGLAAGGLKPKSKGRCVSPMRQKWTLSPLGKRQRLAKADIEAPEACSDLKCHRLCNLGQIMMYGLWSTML